MKQLEPDARKRPEVSPSAARGAQHELAQLTENEDAAGRGRAERLVCVSRVTSFSDAAHR